jgi:hypothetical protein
MTQLSRPFQIVLAALAVLVALWFVALRPHVSGTSGGAGSSASVSRPAKPAAKPKAGHTTVTHATTTTTTTTHAATGAHSTTKTTTHTTTAHAGAAHTSTAHATIVKRSTPAPKPASKHPNSAAGVPSGQSEVEGQLKAGKTVLILFWNPHGAEDIAVHKALPAVERKLGRKIAVHYARASHVGSYGAVTHAVQVNQTPTLLIVNRHGQATTVTGLSDAFAIEQAISAARK